MLRKGQSPLDEGTLYVARFDADGTGVWLPLVARRPCPATPICASILIDTRGAAAAAGRHADGSPGVGRRASQRSGPGLRHVHEQHGPHDADHVNPRVENRFGHIVRWQNAAGDHGAESFTWSMFALAGAGLGTGDGSTIAPGDAFGSPDGLAFDGAGLAVDPDRRQPADRLQQPDAGRRSRDRRPAPVPGRAGRLRDHRLDRRTTMAAPCSSTSNIPARRLVRQRPSAQSNWPDFAGRPALGHLWRSAAATAARSSARS